MCCPSSFPYLVSNNTYGYAGVLCYNNPVLAAASEGACGDWCLLPQYFNWASSAEIQNLVANVTSGCGQACSAPAGETCSHMLQPPRYIGHRVFIIPTNYTLHISFSSYLIYMTHKSQRMYTAHHYISAACEMPRCLFQRGL